MQLDFFRQLTAFLRPAERPAAGLPSAKSGQDTELEKRARGLLRAVGADALAAKVRVTWNPRMRSTAGTAFAARSLVTLNPRLREFGDEEVDRTLRHELAHLLAHARAGRRRIQPHGPEWQQACRDVGLADEKRCHELPLPRRKMATRHFYRCPSCALELQRVRPINRKSACLECCRRHNRGRYDERFRFVKTPPPPMPPK
ncbi:MAG: SprT protein [Chthoniobacter sp.]|jgi:predicted SprT family Zn-dependent metalloprotease|nr:SprT protein [Chthoniobacter sp.]